MRRTFEEESVALEVPAVGGRGKVTSAGPPAGFELAQGGECLAEGRVCHACHSSPDAISLSTLLEGRFVDVNDGFLSQTGYRRQEVIGHTAHDLGIWAVPAERGRLIARLQEQRPVRNLEFRFCTKNRDVRVGLLSANLFQHGGEDYLLSHVRDITEHKQLEEQFRQAQKMEAVGLLSGGIAHDFNNLLMVIQGHGELLLENCGEDPALLQSALEIQKATLSATALTRQLLAFSRKQVLQTKVLDLNTVTAEMEIMLRRLIGEHIELQTILQPGLGRIKADPSQLQQIIINLVVNARDAMPAGGRLTVETANTELDENDVRRFPFVRPGRFVRLVVSDTGIGMDKKTQCRVFEPFFTTKEIGRGTGLGLATVYGIVKQSDGYIWVESESGKGSAFHVLFPHVEEDAEAGEAVAAGKAVCGTETVLLVEDEARLRHLTRAFLESKGYRVLEASNGPEALNLAKRHKGQIHLLLTDMVMPHMSGRAVAERLRSSGAQIKVLYMSGYPADAFDNKTGLGPGEAFLAKPFNRNELWRKVREALGAHSTT